MADDLLGDLIRRAGDVESRTQAIEAFLRSVVLVPSAQEGGDEFTPMVANAGGDDAVICFTTADALAASQAPAASALTMVGALLVLRIPVGLGLLIDAGGQVLALNPSLVEAVRDDVVRRTGA